MRDKEFARALQTATGMQYTVCLGLVRNLRPSAQSIKDKDPTKPFHKCYEEAIIGHFKHADPTLHDAVKRHISTDEKDHERQDAEAEH